MTRDRSELAVECLAIAVPTGDQCNPPFYCMGDEPTPETAALAGPAASVTTTATSTASIYSSHELYPKWLRATLWSRLAKVCLSVSWHVAAPVEFRDESIYEELTKRFEERELPMMSGPRDEAFDVFVAYMNLAGEGTQ